MCMKFYDKNPIVIETGIKTGLKIKYDDPRQVGADRIVNSVAAHNRYGGNLIVIDFGTATTLTCVSEDGSFLGGAIAPGIKTQAAALFEHTAKLPNVDLELPGKFICKNYFRSHAGRSDLRPYGIYRAHDQFHEKGNGS